MARITHLPAPAKPVTTNKTVVVGGGLAGLAAATYLARGGADVVLLERSPEIGGRAISDVHDGFFLNRGVHALYSGGPASAVLRELGVRYASGVPKDVFALDGRVLHRFPASLPNLVRTDLLGAADKLALLGIFVRLGLTRPSTLASRSIADWIASATRRPRLRQLLEAIARPYVYSAALDLVSADLFVAKLQQSMKAPIHYLDGGWQTLVNRLAAAAERAGVRMRTSASVSSVQAAGGLVRGVRLHDGTDLECDQLLLAIPPEDALRLLTPGAAPRLRHVLDQAVAAHVACLDLALAPARLERPSIPYPVVFELKGPRFMSVQSRYARVAPADGAVVHVMKLLDPRRHSDAHADRAELEDFLDRLLPGWQTAAVDRRFLPHMSASGVLPLARTGGLTGRAPARSEDLANVYFAGDWVGPRGFQIDASLGSARACARLMATARAHRPWPSAEPASLAAA
jgi:phytoene dehydrogenase-like protein